jgi:hypothetical protein
MEMRGGWRLLDVDQLDVKAQGRVGRDPGDLLRSISQGGGDLSPQAKKKTLINSVPFRRLEESSLNGGAHGQLSFSTDSHPGDSLVPTLDDLSSAQSEVERRTGSVGVKLLAVEELADVPTSVPCRVKVNF